MSPLEAIVQEMSGQYYPHLGPEDLQAYEDDARCALQALTAAGYVVIHRDVTEPMIAGGRAAVAAGLLSVAAIFNAMIDAHLDETEGEAP